MRRHLDRRTPLRTGYSLRRQAYVAALVDSAAGVRLGDGLIAETQKLAQHFVTVLAERRSGAARSVVVTLDAVLMACVGDVPLSLIHI